MHKTTTHDMTLLNPSHSGEVLREDVIVALGLSVKEAARRLGVSRVALSRVVNGHASLNRYAVALPGLG